MIGYRKSSRILTLRSRPGIVRREVSVAGWTGPDITLAVISDLHVVAPWTSLGHVRAIVAAVNAARPDLVVLAGDYLADPPVPGKGAEPCEIVAALTTFEAPLGTLAILGNHDWQDCKLSAETDRARNSVIEAFEDSPLDLLVNRSVQLRLNDRDFWVVGMDSQLLRERPKRRRHRPDEAFSDVPDGAAAILLAHEPDYFNEGDKRAQVQISGHTHGGQLNLFGWRPVVPSQFGSRYAYGHIQDGDRHLIVSGGVGFSGLPMRIGQPPEVTFVTIKPAAG